VYKRQELLSNAGQYLTQQSMAITSQVQELLIQALKKI
jgi:hypothetical protein